MFPGLISVHFLSLLLLCAVLCLYFFVLQVRFIIGNFSENGLKDGEIKNLVKKSKLIASNTHVIAIKLKSERYKNGKDREQHSFDRDQVKVRILGFRG